MIRLIPFSKVLVGNFSCRQDITLKLMYNTSGSGFNYLENFGPFRDLRESCSPYFS